MTIIIMMTGKEEMIITGRGGEVEAQGEAEVEVLGDTEVVVQEEAGVGVRGELKEKVTIMTTVDQDTHLTEPGTKNLLVTIILVVIEIDIETVIVTEVDIG